MSDRVEAILKLLARNPQDVFLHYSLAMEHVSSGRHDQAAPEFERCIALDAGYLPAYVEGGKSLRAAGRAAEARDLFTRGLSVAQSRNDTHAQDYIRQQLQGLAP